MAGTVTEIGVMMFSVSIKVGYFFYFDQIWSVFFLKTPKKEENVSKKPLYSNFVTAISADSSWLWLCGLHFSRGADFGNI